MKKIINIIALIIISGILWYVDFLYPNDIVRRSLYTALSFLATYVVLNVVLIDLIIRKIKDYKLRYSFRKVINILFTVVVLAIGIRIWIEDPQALLVSYGLIGAGLAIALQDFFKNFIGGIIIILTSLFKVGDRIELNGSTGDVIDVGILYTTIMEIQGWVSGDQHTGRITKIPNGMVLSNDINIFTEDHNYIWDEIKIPITYQSDWKMAGRKILKIAKKETKEINELAEVDIKRLRRRYYIAEKNVIPTVYIRMTDNWIEFSLRYMTNAKQRRIANDMLSRAILEELNKSKKINIASATFDIVGFPDLKIKK